MNEVQSTATGLPALESEALLQRLAFLAARLTAAQLDSFSQRLGQALAACEGDAVDAEPCARACERLRQQTPVFRHLLNEALLKSIRQAAADTSAPRGSDLQHNEADFSALGFEAMERKILIDHLAQSLDATNIEALHLLGRRIAESVPDKGRLDAANSTANPAADPALNPFRAEIFLTAVADAWSAFDPEGETLNAVLHRLRPEVFFRLGAVLRALSRELAGCSTGGRAGRPIPSKAEVAAPHARQSSLPDLHQRLSDWLGAAGARKAEARSSELLERMFAQESLFPHGTRDVLLPLREPLVHMLQADRAFFFDTAHPARALLQAAIDAALACDPARVPRDPRCRILNALPQRLQEQLQTCEAIAEGLQDLAWLQDERLQATVAEAVREENQSIALRLAEDDVAVRLETGEVTGFIETFLQVQWTRVLAFAHEVRDSRPDALHDARRTMDDLIWSVRPKADAAERTSLLGALPLLLSSLNAWLNAVKWEGSERDAFFAQLIEHHTAALRAPLETNARYELEMRMNAVQKASEHLLTRRAREHLDASCAESITRMEHLAEGDWVELVRNNGGKANCRLLFITPARRRFVFVLPQTQLLFTLSDDRLAEALRMSRASILEVRGTVDRALEEALRELGA